MKIRFITPDYPPMMSGLGDYAAHLVQELTNRGHSVRLVTGEPASGESAPVIRETLPEWGFLAAWRLFRQSALDKDDVISIQYVPHAYGRFGWAMGFVIAAFLARFLLGATIVVSLHEIFTDWSWQPRRFLLAAVHRLQLLLICLASRDVIVITEGQRQLLKPYRRMTGKDFYVMYCGPTIPLCPDADAVWKLRSQLAPNNELLLGSFALTVDRTGLMRQLDLVDALGARGLNVRLILLGGQGRHDVVFPSWVTATGILSAAEISTHLQALDLFVHLRAEGPTTRNSSLISALAHGIPCVALPCRYVEETLFWKDSGIDIVPDRDEAILKALEHFLEHEAQRYAKGRQSKAFCQTHFDWKDLGVRFEEILAGQQPAKSHSHRRAA